MPYSLGSPSRRHMHARTLRAFISTLKFCMTPWLI